jgi:hypothetical protein
MEQAIKDIKDEGFEENVYFDGIGLCFPDVVVKNKIVGGEVYKTRGIRNNPNIDYETDFTELTNLDIRLKTWVNQTASFESSMMVPWLHLQRQSKWPCRKTRKKWHKAFLPIRWELNWVLAG